MVNTEYVLADWSCLSRRTDHFTSVWLQGWQLLFMLPVLFLLVMDPILLALKNKPCGLNICGLYLGAFCHADDIRTLASSKPDCSHHISSVEDFASSRGLKLSVEKCEAVISPSLRNAPLSLSGRDICIPVTNAARCLGAWWTPDLSCSTWIDSNIKKARSAFLPEEKTSFKGNLTLCLRKVSSNAVSCRSLCMAQSRGYSTQHYSTSLSLFRPSWARESFVSTPRHQTVDAELHYTGRPCVLECCAQSSPSC